MHSNGYPVSAWVRDIAPRSYRELTTGAPPNILLRIKFSDLNLGILHKLDAGQNRVPEGGRAEAVHGKSRVYTP